MSVWKQVVLTQTIQAHRTGWLGVWDALVAAVTGDKRVTVNVPVTLSVYAKPSENVSLGLAQVEEG